MERWGGLHLRGFVRVMPASIPHKDRVGWSSWAGTSIQQSSCHEGTFVTFIQPARTFVHALLRCGGHHTRESRRWRPTNQWIKECPSARTAPPRLWSASRSRRRLFASNRPRLRGAPPRATRQVPEPAPHGRESAAAAAGCRRRRPGHLDLGRRGRATDDATAAAGAHRGGRARRSSIRPGFTRGVEHPTVS